MNPVGPLELAANRDCRKLMDVALAKRPADLVLTGGRVVNVYTAETLEDQMLAVSDGWIAYCGLFDAAIAAQARRNIDLKGKTVIPGLIDGHTHMAWTFDVPALVQRAMAGGTTTIVTETLEPYPVCGLDGVLDFLDALAGQPIKIFASAPAMVSISPATKAIPSRDLQSLLQRPEILAIGESYWQAVVQEPELFAPLLQAAACCGKLVEGHSAGASGPRLQAYTACGVTSCHEPINAEQAAARMRLGIHVMAREGSIRRDMDQLAKVATMGIDLRRFAIATDGISPGDLLEKGYLEYSLARAIQSGLDPVKAIQAVTINVAEHFRLDHLIGGLAPGRCADMVVLPSPDNIRPVMVFSNGKLVAENGKPLSKARKHTYKPASLDSIRLENEITAADFRIPAPPPGYRMRAIEMKTDLVTAEKIISPPVAGDAVIAAGDQNLLKVAAIDRSHNPGRSFTGVLSGFGLGRGAMASSAAWDTCDIIVIGADDGDMALAVNRIAELNGGTVVCLEGKVLAELALPIFGLCSPLDLKELAAATATVNRAARSLGTPFADPMLSLVTLTGAAIPFLRICHQGLFDLKEGRFKELFVFQKSEPGK